MSGAAPNEEMLAQVMSTFFDAAWYTSRYPDVLEAGIDPLVHYIRFGIGERRNPNRFFDSAWYIEHYPDVQASGMDPLLHYLRCGAIERRDPHPRFDAAYYVDRFPEAAGNPLLYHIRIGMNRGNPTERTLFIEDYLPANKALPEPPAGLTVDVVIPVYRGLQDTKRCLESVLASTEAPLGRIIVVDDQSPEPKLSAWLDKLARSGRITLLRNRRNLGFVRSVNAGMEAAAGNDVVLLNSDTEVPPGWLSRLAAQAYAQPRIASVSPLSNNATICGYPDNKGGEIAFGLPMREVDGHCSRVNAGRSIGAPTTNGFCMYIRRAALDELGLFDAERFGHGYGEENDFCRRAAARAWDNRIACDTFVYHRGSVSFGAEAKSRSKKAEKRLAELYPGFALDVARYVALDAIAPYRFALTAALFASSGLPVVLMVSHDMGGGVSHHINAILDRLEGKARFLLLESNARGARLSVPAYPDHPVVILPPARVNDLASLLQSCGVTRVHLHHLMGMEMDIRALIHRLGVPFDLTVHDYYAICPQVTLLPAPTRFYCNEPGPAGCNRCIAARPSYNASDILSWRAERRWQFAEADRVLCPSNDVLQRLTRFGLGGTAVLAPHEVVSEPVWPLRHPGAPVEKLRIAVLGVLADHKGARTVAALAEAVDPAEISVHLIGHTEDSFPAAALKYIQATGRYAEADLPSLIERIAPHIFWFPAMAPETFSYTLSAAIKTGLPIAASAIGALSERLAGRPMTWLLDHRASPADWQTLFTEIRGVLSAPPQESVAVARDPVPDFYKDSYLSPAVGRSDKPSKARLRKKPRPLIAVLPERYSTGPMTPCAFIRLLQPLDHPAIAGDFDIVLADAKSVLKLRADIIVTQRYALADAAAVDAVAAHASGTGATLLYDIDDDLLNIGRNHPEAEQLRPKAKTVRRMIGQADVVWVSTRALADSFGPLAREITVIPNGLDERIWTAEPPHRPSPAGPARIFCMGTTTHERDFALILPALVRLKQEFGNQVEIDLIGMTGQTDLPPEINRIGVPHGAGLSYPAFVNWLTSVMPGWHIGLAPVLDSPFNRGKSSIKAMDYAALGMMVLASDVGVYRGSIADGRAGTLVPNDPRAWYAALNWFVRNRELCAQTAARAREAFLATSTLAVQAEMRRAAWMRLLDARKKPKAA